MHSPRSDIRGVGIVAVILIVASLSVFGLVVSLLVATGAVSKTNDLVREQAFNLAHAGFEYALKRADEGTNPDGQTKNLGNGQFSVNYDNSGLVTVGSSVSAMYGASNPQFSIQGPPIAGMRDCLVVDTTGPSLTNGQMTLTNITLRNNCQVPISVTAMTVSWNPVGAERLETIVIGSTTYYDNPAGVVSGTEVSLSGGVPPGPLAMPIDCAATKTLSITFSTGMNNKDFTLVFRMGDGTTASAFAHLAVTEEAACLGVDVSGTYVNDTGDRDLMGVTLTNTCGAGSIITVKGMVVTWTDPATRFLSRVAFGGSNAWAGHQSSGVEFLLNTAQVIAGSAPQPLTQDFLEFNGSMRGYNFTIGYRMLDDTIKTVPLDLYETTMAACLVVNNAGASWDAGSWKLINQTWQNTCPRRIVVTQVQTTWNGGMRWQDLQINNVGVWSGNRTSPYTATLSPQVDIPGNTTYTVNWYGFNNTWSAPRTFSHVLYFLTPGTVTVPSYSK